MMLEHDDMQRQACPVQHRGHRHGYELTLGRCQQSSGAAKQEMNSLTASVTQQPSKQPSQLHGDPVPCLDDMVLCPLNTLCTTVVC